MIGSRSRPPNVVDPRQFTFVLNQEIHKATRLQYCFSVLCLAPDLPHRDAGAEFLTCLATLGVGQLRATDLATSLDPSCIALLLVDADTRALPGILERLKEGLGLVPSQTMSAGGSCYPQTATSGSEMLEQAVELMTRAKVEGGGRLVLPS